jgi:hypothetical protein
MAGKARRNITLVVSDKKNPIPSAKVGTKIEVIGVTLMGRKQASKAPMGARLCGGSGTCIALHNL